MFNALATDLLSPIVIPKAVTRIRLVLGSLAYLGELLIINILCLAADGEGILSLRGYGFHVLIIWLVRQLGNGF